MSGPSTCPPTFRKFMNPLSLFTASTVTCPTLPSCVTRMSKSVDIGGLATDRTTCAQNFPYDPDAAQYAPPRCVASDVYATALPSPACQLARIGSLFSPATSATSICGLLFLLVS